MRDLKPIEELSDAHLAAMSAKARQPSDLEASKDQVFSLEIKLREAQNAHNRTFCPGMTDAKAMASQLAIDRIQENLHWAMRHLADIETAARMVELRNAQLASPDVSRLFEITCDDGRKMRQSALDAQTLQKSLNAGYRVTGQVFRGGYVKPLDGPAPMFDGWLDAHGEELCTYLAERGFIIRRGDAA